MSTYDPASAEVTSPLATFRAGDRFGDYTIDFLLGVGGMACVYAATTRSGEEIALKVLRDDRADNSDVRRQFMQEARTGAKLHHRNIVRFVDFGTHQHRLYLAMERVNGTSLWQWVKSPPHANDLLDVFDQILSALAHAHARGVTHRDLKPDNILLERNAEGQFRVRLIDFGVARHQEESSDELETSVVGTPEYMSPEQCLGSPTVSAPSDIYAVGVMLYELISGHLPFGGPNAAATLLAHLRDPLPPLIARSRYILRSGGEHTIRRFLAREPADRFRNAAAARLGLQSLRMIDADAGPDEEGFAPAGAIHRSEPPPVSAGLFLVSEPPFVDLHGQLRELQHRVQEHIQHEPNPMAVLISGMPGSGRSRLLCELASRLEAHGDAQIWHLETHRHARTILALQAMLQRHYPLPIMHPDDRAHRLEDQLLADGIRDRALIETAVSFLLGEAGVDPNTETTTWRLIERLIAAATRRQRLVIILEDPDEGNGQIIATLRRLVPKKSPHAPILLTSFRSDAESLHPILAESIRTLSDDKNAWVVERRELQRLGLLEMRQFLQRAIDISPNVATLLADRADGNPNFALMILRSILTRYGDDVLRDPVTLDRALADLPEDIGEILTTHMESMWRSENVPRPILEALEALAVLGQNIPRGQAIAILAAQSFQNPAQTLVDILSTPALSSVVQEHDDRIQFHDRLTREAIVTRAKREGRDTDLHRLCVEIKLAQKAERAENIADIAEHCMAAGMFKRARRLFYDAFQTQKRQMHPIEALRHIDGAVHTVELDPSPDPADLAELLIERADLLIRLSRFSEVQTTLDALDQLQLHRDETPSPRLLRLRAAAYANVHGDTARARIMLDEAVRAADAHGHTYEGVRCRLALTHLDMASGALATGEKRLRSLLQYEQEEELPASIYGNILLQLSLIAMLTGAHDAARGLMTHARERFASSNDPYGAASTELIEGRLELLQGNLRTAWDLLRGAQEEFLSIGDRHVAALALSWLGVVADAWGHSQRARVCWEQALDSFERANDAPMVALCKLRLAALDAQEGHWRSAGQLLLDSLSQSHIDPLEEVAWSDAMVRMAKEAIMAGREALARDLLERAHKRLANTGSESFIYDHVEEIAHLIYQLEV